MARLLVLLALLGMADAMGIIIQQNNNGYGGGGGKKFTKGDWPDKFPQHPAGFSYNCKDRQFGTVTLPPQSPAQPAPQQDEPGNDIVTVTTQKVTTPTTTHDPTTPTTTTTTTTVKPSTSTLLTTILTTAKATPKAPETGTTFWIRTPTPPNKPNPVDPNSGSFTLGVPIFGTPKIDKPHAPDQALNPLDANLADSDGFDFNIATVGTPKAPRAVVDPDA